MKNYRQLILASSSPRRQKILEENGYNFSVISPNVEEVVLESAKSTVIENARLKAEEVFKNNTASVVIAADTVVCLADKILGKPDDLIEAAATLKLLSGKTHEVFTAVSIRSQSLNEDFNDVSEVKFKDLDDETINEYFSQCNPLDKAGGYNIDEHGDLIIEEISGSYENIMGFPIEKFKKVIKKFNF